MQSTTTYSEGWSASLVGDDEAPVRSSAILRRLAGAALLSALFGLALGARQGGLALITHAAGVPAGLLAVAILGVPALYIVLALTGAPVRADRLLDAASRASATASLVLAGLAPATAMYVVTAQEPETAQAVAVVVLVGAGGIGLRSMLRSIHHQLDEADSAARFAGLLVALGFALFAAVLAARVWGGTLAILGGTS